jgi:hypothetical protein
LFASAPVFHAFLACSPFAVSSRVSLSLPLLMPLLLMMMMPLLMPSPLLMLLPGQAWCEAADDW